MLRYTRFWLLVSMLLLTTPLNAQTSSPVWIAWLSGDGRVMGVTDNGTVIGYYTLPSSSAVGSAQMLSYSGRYAAYLDNTAYGESPVFTVYDSGEDRIIVQYRLPPNLWEAVNPRPGPQYFDQEETRVTLSYTDFSSDPLVIGPWHYWGFDLATGAVIHELTVQSDDTPPGCFGCTPFTRRFVGDQLDFMLSHLGMEDNFRTYSWNLATGDINFDDRLFTGDNWNFEVETLWHTGEIIWPRYDDRFPIDYALPIECCAPPNMLYVYDPRIGERFPFYHTSNLMPHRPRFIQGGERILFWSYSQETQNYTWYVVERDGRLAEVILPEFGISPYELQIAGTPDGFVYLTRGLILAPSLYLNHVNTREGGLVETIILQGLTEFWQLSHVAYQIEGELGEWARLDAG